MNCSAMAFDDNVLGIYYSSLDVMGCCGTPDQGRSPQSRRPNIFWSPCFLMNAFKMGVYAKSVLEDLRHIPRPYFLALANERLCVILGV
jgi:hypothetical protein